MKMNLYLSMRSLDPVAAFVCRENRPEAEFVRRFAGRLRSKAGMLRNVAL